MANCSVETISDHTKGFEFASLYKLYLDLNQTCASESNIFFEKTRMLTNTACEHLTGNDGSIWDGWTAYPISDIWNRIVVWKLPLLQLLSQFPRPPLGPSVETGIMMHLLGDPIDSVASMLLSLAICQKRAKQAKELCIRTGMQEDNADYPRTWKGLAIIMVSYDECGASEKIENFLQTYRRMARKQIFDSDIRHIYEETAGSLAADRQTRTLPVALAELFFIAGWVISLIKAASSEPGPTNWVNVEAQSIAISALYLWVISTVVIASLIGASQTEDSIPRILHGLEYQLNAFPTGTTRRPSIAERIEISWCKRTIDRAVHGGTYSWYPLKWEGEYETCDISTAALITYSSMAVVFVGCSFFISATISYLVPPRGFNCRHIPESIVFSIWLLSFITDFACEKIFRQRVLFWTVFWKDVVCALATIAIIILVQWGIMNRCSCWSGWGSTWVHLPQLPEVKTELMHFIRDAAPGIVFAALMLHFVFCIAVTFWFRDAIRVFIQRDDGESNLAWWREWWAHKK